MHSKPAEATRPRRGLKLGATIALIGGALAGAFSVSAAYAADSGYSGPFTVNGVGYQNRSTADAGPSWASWVRVSSGTAGDGWIGVNARLLNAGDGSLCSQTGYLYNSGSPRPAGTEFVNTGGGSCGSGNYYSQGLTQHWNGGGYDTWYALQSPNVSY